MPISKNDLINLLIEQTKQNNLKWEYLNNHMALNDLILKILSNVQFLFAEIKDDKSFFTVYKKGFFVLVATTRGAFLIVIPSLDSRSIEVLNQENQYQSELTRLTALALKQHPNVDDFLDEFMTEFKPLNDL